MSNKWVSCLRLLLVALACPMTKQIPECRAESVERPNVVVIFADDLG